VDVFNPLLETEAAVPTPGANFPCSHPAIHLVGPPLLGKLRHKTRTMVCLLLFLHNLCY
jgi:hypothetical protein